MKTDSIPTRISSSSQVLFAGDVMKAGRPAPNRLTATPHPMATSGVHANRAQGDPSDRVILQNLYQKRDRECTRSRLETKLASLASTRATLPRLKSQPACMSSTVRNAHVWPIGRPPSPKQPQRMGAMIYRWL